MSQTTTASGLQYDELTLGSEEIKTSTAARKANQILRQ